MIDPERLNLFPVYKKPVKQKLKISSVRLGDRCSEYKAGGYVLIALSWIS